MTISEPMISIPVPDPSTLTTAQTQREIAILREEVNKELRIRQETREKESAALKENLSTRIEGMEKATAIRALVIDGLPSEMEKQINHLRELMEEKFMSIATQFKERDTRSEREARDNKLAVDAAFAAQEKQAVAQNESNALAISKSEAVTAEQITTNQAASKSTTDTLGKVLDEVKGQVLTILASGVGAREVRSDQRSNFGVIVAVASLVAAIVGAVLAQLFGS